ncbi:MAG: hypothetical protein ACPGQL_02800 [Thermoplasmatota archaeon]
MRTLLLCGLLATAVLAGCLDDEPDEEPAPAEEAPVTQAPERPENITESGSWIVETAEIPLCVGECLYAYDFDLGVNASLDLHLVWDNGLSDLDLYLYEGSDLVGFSNELTGSSETVSVRLDPGSYRIEVIPYRAVSATFQLEGTFEVDT